MTNYTERNPFRMAAIGLALCALFVVTVFQVDRLPLVGSVGENYRAEFLDAGGLQPGDWVEVAGVQVGQVRDIEIQADHVVVDFEVDSSLVLSDQTTAAVKIGDLLGSKFLDVTPVAGARLPEESVIPLERTVEAYDVVAAFADLTEVQERLDTEAMAASMQTLADTFRNSPREIRGALDGIAALSRTVNTRDEAIRSLLQHAEAATGALAERRGDLVQLVQEGNQLLTALLARKEAIHRLLVSTSAVAVQLEGLARDNQATLRPALAELTKVVDLLAAHQDDLSLIVKNLATYVRVFTNTVGSGPWFDSWVPDLPDSFTMGGPQ